VVELWHCNSSNPLPSMGLHTGSLARVAKLACGSPNFILARINQRGRGVSTTNDQSLV
jgi:hypothetical protein